MLSRSAVAVRIVPLRAFAAPSPPVLCTCILRARPPGSAVLQSRAYASKKKSKSPSSSSSSSADATSPPRGGSDAGPTYDLVSFLPPMDAAVDRLRVLLKPLIGRVGPVSPDLLTNLRVAYEGHKTPLGVLASITIASPSTLLVKPYDPATLSAIQAAIYSSPLNLAPQPVGDLELKVPIPKVDWDKREGWVREASALVENSRVAVRAERAKAAKALKAGVDSKQFTKEDARVDVKELDAATKRRTDEIDAVFDKAKKLLLDA